MDNNLEKITFETEDGTEDFYVLEQTMLGGINYILVTDEIEGEEGSFLVLKEEKDSKEDEAFYQIIEDDNELKAVISVFNELLEDIDLEV
ncbi:MAG: DUF1292 domain-containing protein [Lachnospiraceae bacterium]|nr:DUF1292 domain-containing protein [Lachnospiraceae bacterium]